MRFVLFIFQLTFVLIVVIKRNECLSIIYDKRDAKYTCITQNEKSIIWDPKEGYTSEETFKSIHSNTINITENVQLNGFNLTDSIDDDLGLLTDYRWEILPINTLEKPQNKSKHLYYIKKLDKKITTIIKINDNKYNFSFVPLNDSETSGYVKENCTLHVKVKKWVPIYLNFNNLTQCTDPKSSPETLVKNSNNSYYKTNKKSSSLNITNLDFQKYQYLTFFYALGPNCSLNFTTNLGESQVFHPKQQRTNETPWIFETFKPNKTKGLTYINVTAISELSDTELENTFWAIDDIMAINGTYYRSLQLDKNLTCLEFGTNKFVSVKTPNGNWTDKNNCSEKKLINNLWEKDNVTVCCNDECYEKIFIAPKENKTDENYGIGIVNKIVQKSSYDKNLLFLWILLVIPVISIGVAIYFVKKYINRKFQILKETNDGEQIQLMPNSPLLSEPFTGIKNQDFVQYVKDAFDPEQKIDLDLQFTRLGTIENDYTATVGAIGPNRLKNRYEDIIPYDETRVKLKCEDEASNYINANYIKFEDGVEYIATQNPSPSTTQDFCKMIWDENITHIITVSNENTAPESLYKYWPADTKKSFKIDQFIIGMNVEHNYEHYVVRQLIFTLNKVKKTVKQYHYCTFPNKNEPLYPHVFMDFFKALAEVPHYSNPVLVHSKSGTQLAGFMILCDKVIRSLVSSTNIDIYKTLKDLRRCRMKMLNDARLYKLVHLIVAEHILSLSLATGVDETFSYRTQRMLENNGENVCEENLEILSWYDKALNTMSFKDNLPGKNRYAGFVAADHCRVKLQHISPNYINAMYVTAYKRTFITTQQPLPTTLSDFYIMVLQHDIDLIVNLNTIDLSEDTSEYFCPNYQEPYKQLKPMPNVLIQYEEMIDFQDYELVTCGIIQNNQPHKKLSVINFKNWDKSKNVPDKPEAIITVYNTIKKLTGTKRLTTLLTCENGISACGVLVALFYILEKMDKENRCDVETAVRTLRHSHPKFINKEQLKFLYLCASRKIPPNSPSSSQSSPNQAQK